MKKIDFKTAIKLNIRWNRKRKISKPLIFTGKPKQEDYVGNFRNLENAQKKIANIFILESNVN